MGHQVIGGGGQCGKGDALINSAPVYGGHSEGWAIDCRTADTYGSYGKKGGDECTVYAVCASYSFQQQQSYY
jgi:hypothetical protein